jgi:hypothetical protein
MLRSDLEAHSVEIKELKHKLDHSSRYSVLSPPCETCGSLKGKHFHATKENTELKQEVAYLTSRLERTVVSEKMIEDDLNHVEESTTTSMYKLGVAFERCENKGENSAPKFVPSSNYHKKEKNNQIHQNLLPIQSKSILQPHERGKERNPQAKR